MSERVLCICGCGNPADISHHVIRRQDLRQAVKEDWIFATYEELVLDPRNMVPMAQSCHERHHSRSRPLRLSVLPDEAFEFAADVLGAGRAFNYLRRGYTGDDSRLSQLLVLDSQG
jgi:hypothetical protein